MSEINDQEIVETTNQICATFKKGLRPFQRVYIDELTARCRPMTLTRLQSADGIAKPYSQADYISLCP